MKKIVKLFIMAMMMISVVACSGGNNLSDEVKNTDNPVSSVINVYTRDASSGTREAFEKEIGLEEGSLTDKASEVSSNGDMATKVGLDANGIGYASMTTQFEANGVKPLKFEGVEASIETVLDGSYKMQRPFNYVTRAAHDYISTDMEELVSAFIAYITESVEGLSVIEGAGGIVDYTNAKPWEDIAVNYPVLNQDNSGLTIRTGGSTSVEKCIKAALEAFKPLAGNVNFAMNQTGSGDGPKRTIGEEKDGANAVEIGFASRDFKDSEGVDGSNAAYGSFCKDAVVAIVNVNNPIENISADSLKAIYNGTLTSFEDIK